METYILKTKYYNNCIEQTYYKKKNIFKMKDSSPEDKIRSSRSRAISRIKEIIRCNKFDYFFTLTIKDDIRFDIERSINYINKSILNYSRRCSYHNINFKYIYIFELTKKRWCAFARLFFWILRLISKRLQSLELHLL